MAWTTPGTAVAGDVLTAAFWNSNVRDNSNEFAPLFAAWTTYTPQIDQGATTNIAKTVTYARYLKIGRLAIVQARLDISGTGTAGSAVTITLPTAVVPVSNTASAGYFGWGLIFDNSTNTQYVINVRASTTTQLSFASDVTSNNFWGAVPSIAIAASDQMHFSFICETTS